MRLMPSPFAFRRSPSRVCRLLGWTQAETALTSCPNCERLSLTMLCAWIGHFSGTTPCASPPIPLNQRQQKQWSCEPECKGVNELMVCQAQRASECTDWAASVTPVLIRTLSLSESSSCRSHRTHKFRFYYYFAHIFKPVSVKLDRYIF